MSQKCPRKGSRVTFLPNPAARMFYDSRSPDDGATGTVTDLPVGGGRRTCMPGPRGGLVYVNWDDGSVEGVFRADLKVGKPKRRR